MTPALPADLAAALDEISGRSPHGGGFGHREHVHLAFAAARRYGTEQAGDVACGWLRLLTAHEPRKYHATVTRAWAEIIAHHVAADPAATDFDGFAGRHPALLGQRLLGRHYSAAVLASQQARADWAEPDLAQFPWRPGRRTR